MKRNVLTHVIAHRHIALLHGPFVGTAVVDRTMRGGPSMRQTADTLRVDVRIGRVVTERRDDLRLILLTRLEPHRLAVRQRHGKAVVITAHAAQVTKVVIERAVLLHEDNNVLHVLNRTRNRSRLDCERFANRVRETGWWRLSHPPVRRTASENLDGFGDHALTFFVFYGE